MNYSLEEKFSEPYEVYIEYNTLKKIIFHTCHDFPFETMGFLIGDVFRWNDREYTEIIDYGPVKSVATISRVIPAEGALGKFVGKYLHKFKNKILVGWYHSHPNYGCFLSEIDLDSQRRYFPQAYHVALVVDPVRKEFSFFKLEKEGGYREASYKVFRDAGSRKR
jgi:26S proteasome regulatory subunit N11